MIIYEYPFNEHIRTLLRIEGLYEKYHFFLHQEESCQHHIALITLFDIIEVLGRSDLKSDLLLELERQKNLLLTLKTNPNIEITLLNSVLEEIEHTYSILTELHGKPGQHIRDNEWLMNIKSRIAHPGGMSHFDLPSYYAWQHKKIEERRHNILSWFAPLTPLIHAIRLLLRLLRQSGTSNKVSTLSGSYQKMLQGKTYQMLQLTLSDTYDVIPEISANKYMLWVHFMLQDPQMKLKAVEEDIPFELTLCNF